LFVAPLAIFVCISLALNYHYHVNYHYTTRVLALLTSRATRTTRCAYIRLCRNSYGANSELSRNQMLTVTRNQFALFR
jgi:hypothetical protein